MVFEKVVDSCFHTVWRRPYNQSYSSILYSAVLGKQVKNLKVTGLSIGQVMSISKFARPKLLCLLCAVILTSTINILLARIRVSLKLSRSEQHSDNKGNSYCSLKKERLGDVGGNIIHITPSSDEPTVFL